MTPSLDFSNILLLEIDSRWDDSKHKIRAKHSTILHNRSRVSGLAIDATNLQCQQCSAARRGASAVDNHDECQYYKRSACWQFAGSSGMAGQYGIVTAICGGNLTTFPASLLMVRFGRWPNLYKRADGDVFWPRSRSQYGSAGALLSL